jgi:hypothetical protein
MLAGEVDDLRLVDRDWERDPDDADDIKHGISSRVGGHPAGLRSVVAFSRCEEHPEKRSIDDVSKQRHDRRWSSVIECEQSRGFQHNVVGWTVSVGGHARVNPRKQRNDQG